MNRKIVVWYNPNKEQYYYKYVKGYSSNYFEGLINQYGHVIVLVIDGYVRLNEIQRPSIKKRLIRKAISFLEKKL